MPYNFRSALTILVVGVTLFSGAETFAQTGSKQNVLPPNVEILDPGPTKPFPTMRGSIHICPDGFAVSGIHAGKNVLLCMRMLRQGYQLSTASVLSTGISSTNQFTQTTQPALRYQGPDLHWCGPNRFMVGIDLRPNTNTLLCATWSASPPVGGGAPPIQLVIDQPPSVTVRKDLHACPLGWAVKGVNIHGNIFVCGKVVP